MSAYLCHSLRGDVCILLPRVREGLLEGAARGGSGFPLMSPLFAQGDESVWKSQLIAL